MTTTETTETTTTPAWRKVEWPDGAGETISRVQAHNAIENNTDASCSEISDATKLVTGADGETVTRADFDAIQQRLFAEPEPAEQATPTWKRVDFPEEVAEIGVPRVHELLDDEGSATREKVEAAIQDVVGTRYWVREDDFDKVQQKLFAAPEPNRSGLRFGIGASVLRAQLIAENFAQDDVATAIGRAMEVTGQSGITDPVFTASEETELRTNLRAATNIPEDAGSDATARILAQRLTIRRLENIEQEFDAFKERVVSVASDYAQQHGWCSVVDEALGDLGLERHPKKYVATAVIRVKFIATLRERQELPGEGWVRDSIREGALREAIRGGFELDADHDGVEVDYVDIDDVEDVEEYEE